MLEINVDPFDHWYLSQIDLDAEKNYKPGEWDFFALSYDAGSSKEAQETVLQPEEVDSWVNQIEQAPSQAPGLDLFISRYKDLGKKDMIYRWLPFPTKHFKDILRRLQLPAQYFHMRSTGGAQSGGMTYRTYRDDSGRVSRIIFVIRAAHTSVLRHSSAWSFVFAWDARTCRTTAFLDGITHSDLLELKSHLKACSPLLGHPLTLPEISLHMIIAFVNERIRIPSEEEYYEEERRTGLSRVHQVPPENRASIWNWNFKDFQDSTSRANKFITTLGYMKTRFGFAMHLTKRLLDVLDNLETYEWEDSGMKAKLNHRQFERKERLLNRLGCLENYARQTECMQLRAQNLITVLYTVVSQIDSRNQGRIASINLLIAQAVRSESIPVRTIAYVTLILLPGAFIAAIFGMNFFLFDPETRSLIVANTFWQYWAVTLPVTIFVVALWNFWVYQENKHDQVKGSLIPNIDLSSQLGDLEMDFGDLQKRAYIPTPTSQKM